MDLRPSRTTLHLPGPLLSGLLFMVALAWGLLFTTESLFWVRMAGVTFTLGALGVALGPPGRFRMDRRELLWGIGSAAMLYAVFFAGRAVLLHLGWGRGIETVYEMKAGFPAPWIALLLVFPIGPGEELFWRGLIQPAFQTRWGRGSGWIAAAVTYGLVHLVTGNPVLILAALICGLFWGALVELRGGLSAAVISHALWDLAVFVIWPLG